MSRRRSLGRAGSVTVGSRLVLAIAILALATAARAQIPPAKGSWHPVRGQPASSGVTVNDSLAACPGINLVVPGHAPEALLMDNAGYVVHSWTYDGLRAFTSYRPRGGPENHTYWRRAYLLPNGSLLAIYEGIGLIKLDRYSKLLWAYPGKAHHDLDVGPDGRIYVLARDERPDPDRNRRRPIREDCVAVLDADGRELQRVSVLEALKKSEYAGLLAQLPVHGNLLQTASVQLLDGGSAGRLPAFAAGNLLLSILKLDLVAVLDPQAEKVVWALQGPFKAPQAAQVLADGHLLVFDSGDDSAAASRVVEIDPLTGEIVWDETGSPEQPFHSVDCGASRRLPNGDTLVVESDAGRAFEVTPDGRLVWEYYTPQRGGPRQEFIATLADVVRYPPGYVDWLP